MTATSSTPHRSRSESISMSYQMSPTHPSSKRALSTAVSPRNIGFRGKRARTSASPSLSSFSDTILPGSPGGHSAPLVMVSTNLACSAPTTPLLPSSSADFFPVVRSSSSQNVSHMQLSPSPPPRHSRARLDDLHREAFSSLRQSLSQSGEGFVRRMRDWEKRRASETSKSSMPDVLERGRDKRAGRRHRSSPTDHCMARAMSAPHPDRDGYEPYLSLQADSDVEDDIQIDGVSHPLPLASPEKVSGNVSLEEAINVSGSSELFAVGLSESDTERYPSAQYTSTFDFPFKYSTTRSCSPFSFGNTSDDESSAGSRNDQAHSGFSSPRATSNFVDWSSHALSIRDQSGTISQFEESMHHSSPGISPSPSSPNLSHPLVTLQRHTHIQSHNHISKHKQSENVTVSESGSQVPQTVPDQALAAIVLALANGSGSLADYGYVRDAQGELEELEGGALWE